MTDPVPSSLTEPSAPSARTYVAVWVVLVVLATVTLVLAQLPTGGWGLVIALSIASFKAALVLVVFMHLGRDRPLHRLIIGVGLVFVVLLLAGVLGDVGTRDVAGPYVGDTVP